MESQTAVTEERLKEVDHRLEQVEHSILLAISGNPGFVLPISNTADCRTKTTLAKKSGSNLEMNSENSARFPNRKPPPRYRCSFAPNRISDPRARRIHGKLTASHEVALTSADKHRHGPAQPRNL
jgi:hypothetical protein